jgi:hypothetical protein
MAVEWLISGAGRALIPETVISVSLISIRGLRKSHGPGRPEVLGTLLTQRSWVRFPVLPDILCSSGSGTGSTQPL